MTFKELNITEPILKAIKEKELPELDDEFAAEVSRIETLEDYKADIKEKVNQIGQR